MSTEGLIRAGFGGGCHWCTEAVFQSLRGVDKVEQGFIASDAPDDGFSEAVIVHFDPGVIALDDLIAVHLATHASSSDHKMRGKYRSAIYAFGDEQVQAAAKVLGRIRAENEAEFVTRILPYRGFKASDTRFHNYYETDPDRPFCERYISPKIAKLRQDFARILKESRLEADSV